MPEKSSGIRHSVFFGNGGFAVKPIRWLDENIEEIVLVVLLVVISCVMMAQVFARYVFNDSMTWPEEFCRYCYVWTVFLSLGYTIKRGNMLRVGVVMDLFPTWIQNSVTIVINFIMLVLFWALFQRAVGVVLHIKNVTGEISSAMRLPMWLMYMSTVAGFGLGLLRTVQAIVRNFRHFGDKAETTIQATLKEAQTEAELAAQDDRAYRREAQGSGA